MRKQKNFTEEQKCKLLKSPFVEKVYSNHIVYSIEFKQIAISKYKQGVIPVKIFIDADLDLELIGKKNAFNLIKKWLKESDKLPKFKSLEQEVKELRERNSYLEEMLYATKKFQELLD